MVLPVKNPYEASPRPWQRIRAWLGDLDNVLFLALMLATIAPLWCFRYFPSQDGPAHLENATILKEYYWPDREIYRTYYTIDTHPNPNWVGHLLLVGLMVVAPPLIAEKVLLTGYLILLPVSLRYALNAVRPGAGALALLAFPLTPNLFYHMGFHNFCYSLALFFFVVGYWLKHRDHLGWRETATLSALGLVLYFCHLVSLAAAGVAVGIAAAWLTILDVRAEALQRRVGLPFIVGILRSRFVPLFCAALPALLLALLFLKRRGLNPADTEASTAGVLLRLEALVCYNPQERLVAEGLAAALAALTVYLLLTSPRRWRAESADGVLLAAFAFVALFFLMPTSIAGGTFISYRMTLYAVFALILWFGAQPGVRSARWAIRAVAVMATLLFLALHVHAYAQLNDYLEEYLCVTDQIEPNSTLLPVSFSHAGQTPEGTELSCRVGPFFHAAGHIVARKPVIHLINYEATTGYFPIRYRPELNPYHLMGKDNTVPHRGLHALPPDIDFLHYPRPVDYVLIWDLPERRRTDKRAVSLFRQLEEDGYEQIDRPSRLGLVLLYRRKDLKLDADR
jgi:hypothetical protein